ncbi:hypothetical protein BN1723_010578 [Verticillium longisporum]|uniref:ERCC4 domain-containing protein n=1 Tax=Verticillium longisporum TaxID=100787 RepID=A0A0G4KZH6_VERLO|nr:hypothetical protein BN1723_010578 [Verticillium longisporum]
MTGEVISLLSSSSPEPALPPAPAAAPHPAKPCSPPPKQPPGLLDLTSSSPISAPKRDRPLGSQQLPHPKRRSSAVQLDLHFLSDDFDTTGDLGHSSQIRQDAGQNKRLRLSPPDAAKRGFQRSQSAAGAAERSSARQGAALRRTQTLIDPIECSSSPALDRRPRSSGQTTYDDPFATSSPVRKAGGIVAMDEPRAASPRRPEMAAVAASLGIDVDDPFASSPPPAAEAAPASAPAGSVTVASTAKSTGASKVTSKTSMAVLSLDDDLSDPFASSQPDAAQLRATASTAASLNSRPRSPKDKVNWDPISSSAPQLLHDSFDSSPPPVRSKGKEREPAVVALSDSEASVLESHKWSDSDSDLPDVKDMDLSKSRAPRSHTTARSRTSSATLKVSKSTAPVAKKSAENKTRDKEAKAAEREREKERKKREKEAAKEQKARDKEVAAAMAEVNKVRTDKKVSTPEMIVDLPASLPPAQLLQAQTLLRDLDVEFGEWQSPVEKVVKWRRKVKSRFNDDLGLWEPMPLRIQDESYAMAVMTADEFVALALGAEGADLPAHVSRMKQHFPGTQLIYLMEGLGPWIRKNRNVRNRQFVSAVRSQETEAAPTSSQPSQRRKKAQAPKEYIDEDTVEDALLELQVLHGALIHHTAAAVETAQWIAVFTQHISTVPYRKQREAANAAGAGFCMESGQVRTGDDTRDTYARMLQEIVRVTAPVAYGVAEEFGTVTALVEGLEERGPLALEACRKSANKDGAVSDRTIGQALSRRIYKVFTGKDETSMDV